MRWLAFTATHITEHSTGCTEAQWEDLDFKLLSLHSVKMPMLLLDVYMETRFRVSNHTHLHSAGKCVVESVESNHCGLRSRMRCCQPSFLWVMGNHNLPRPPATATWLSFSFALLSWGSLKVFSHHSQNSAHPPLIPTMVNRIPLGSHSWRGGKGESLLASQPSRCQE